MTFLNSTQKEYPLEIRAIPVVREAPSIGLSRRGMLILRKVPYPGNHTILVFDFPIKPGGYALYIHEYLENPQGELERVGGGWLPVEYWTLPAEEAVSARSKSLYENLGEVFNDPDAYERLVPLVYPNQQ